MRSSEQGLGQKLADRHKDFAPFEFTESLLEGHQNQKIDHFIGAKFDDDELSGGGDPQPVLGLNLLEYFQKSHLVDQLPVEPLPPIENPLEMTQNHEDWVRSQEDFKIGLEKLKGLHKPEAGTSGAVFPSELVGDVPADVFNLEAQHEMEAYTESLKSASSFDGEGWDALTQAHNSRNGERGKIEEVNFNGVSQTRDEDEMQKLLEFEPGKDKQNVDAESKNNSHLFGSKSNKTKQYILKDLEMGENSQTFQVNTFIEHEQPQKLSSITHQPNNADA